jgi:hypothetical protein
MKPLPWGSFFSGWWADPLNWGPPTTASLPAGFCPGPPAKAPNRRAASVIIPTGATFVEAWRALVTYKVLCQQAKGVLRGVMRSARWSTPDAADCDDQESTGCL